MNQSKAAAKVSLQADSFVLVSAAPGEVLGQSGALEKLISHARMLKGCALSWWQGKRTAPEDTEWVTSQTKQAMPIKVQNVRIELSQ